MTTPSHSDGHSISERQNQHEMLVYRAAARQAYDLRDRIRAVRTFATVALAVAAPVLAAVWPGGSSALSVIAALWLLAGRTFLTSWHQQQHLRGLRAQELLDTVLFRLPWNETLAGPRSATVEDVAALRATPAPKDEDWYEDVPTVPWPLDVLACQVQNLLWARRNHRAYALLLRILGGVVAVAALALAWVQDMSVSEFMVRLFVPLMPALLDLVEMPRQHDTAARMREEVEITIEALWDKHTGGRTVTDADCRTVQDGLYATRKSAPPIPGWLHKRLHASTNSANAARMNEIREQIAGT
ncbi:S-4TM family putative pore-forming effector [Streptomyces sp. TS71-3]|uniref:S-4TM family putative pore-forming effector n=1 Tax=Streptomyces sp. TS71-3 TaxID=2733862 RepID=UPI001B2CDB52|nr:S-4TM family putative pore-forming effector [Streptomyces sp. TS71-3]GHJ35478.1 hypothetical protein Sm713_10870 [Streptomyces sp. TS71-3]